jgi:hypothetical protein
MEIKFSCNKGRSEVTSSVVVDNLSSEENLQEVFLSVVDFLITLGAEFPDELLDILKEYDDD